MIAQKWFDTTDITHDPTFMPAEASTSHAVYISQHPNSDGFL